MTKATHLLSTSDCFLQPRVPSASVLPKTHLCLLPTACHVLIWAPQVHHIMDPTCLSGFIPYSPFSLEVQTFVAEFQLSLTFKPASGFLLPI